MESKTQTEREKKIEAAAKKIDEILSSLTTEERYDAFGLLNYCTECWVETKDGGICWGCYDSREYPE